MKYLKKVVIVHIKKTLIWKDTRFSWCQLLYALVFVFASNSFYSEPYHCVICYHFNCSSNCSSYPTPPKVERSFRPAKLFLSSAGAKADAQNVCFCYRRKSPFEKQKMVLWSSGPDELQLDMKSFIQQVKEAWH